MSPSSSAADCRWLAAGSAALLAACSGPDAAPEPEGDTVACAVGGVSELSDECIVEKVRQDGANNLVIHHPDGGFRRFIVLPGENALVPADGADLATSTGPLVGMSSETRESVEVTVGQDRYVIPLTLMRSDAQ